MTQTKIIKIATAIWAILAAIYESNLLANQPEINDWLKLLTAIVVILINYVNGKNVQTKVMNISAKNVQNASIGGGGIKNPPPGGG